MKVTVNIECTPEEARRYLGIPEIPGLNTLMMDEMSKQMKLTFGPDMFTQMWEPFYNFWTVQSKGR